MRCVKIPEAGRPSLLDAPDDERGFIEWLEVQICSHRIDIGAELGALRSAGVSPSTVAVERGIAIHMVAEDDIIRAIDFYWREGSPLPALLMADLGGGRGWAVFDGRLGAFADDFLTRGCAVRWLAGDFDDPDSLHEEDLRISRGEASA